MQPNMWWERFKWTAKIIGYTLYWISMVVAMGVVGLFLAAAAIQVAGFFFIAFGI